MRAKREGEEVDLGLLRNDEVEVAARG